MRRNEDAEHPELASASADRGTPPGLLSRTAEHALVRRNRRRQLLIVAAAWANWWWRRRAPHLSAVHLSDLATGTDPVQARVLDDDAPNAMALGYRRRDMTIVV